MLASRGSNSKSFVNVEIKSNCKFRCQNSVTSDEEQMKCKTASPLVIQQKKRPYTTNNYYYLSSFLHPDSCDQISKIDKMKNYSQLHSRETWLTPCNWFSPRVMFHSFTNPKHKLHPAYLCAFFLARSVSSIKLQ